MKTDQAQHVDGWLAAAISIVQTRLWCAIEVWGDSPARRWEPRLLICQDDIACVEAAIDGWIAGAPDYTARVAGYTRDRLLRAERAPTALCRVAGAP